MAVTATLTPAPRANGLRYLLTQDGAAGTTLTITTTGGGATPDLQTDSPAGKIRQIAKAFTQGYFSLGPGALIQSQARVLWTATATSSAAVAAMFARCTITPRSGATAPGWFVDANVDGSGHPTLTITAQAGAGTAYLDVELEGGAIGA